MAHQPLKIIDPPQIIIDETLITSDKPSQYLHIQDEYRKWNKENLTKLQKNFGNLYNLHKLSLKSKVKLYKERQQAIIERLQQGNTPVYNLWANTEHSNMFFESPSIFAILEDDFARNVDPTQKVEQLPEEEQGVYLDYLADVLQDDIEDYIKEFHKFLKGYYEYVYLSSKLLEIIGQDNMISEVHLTKDTKVILTPIVEEDTEYTRKEAAKYLGFDVQTLDRRIKVKEFADILQPRKEGRHKYKKSNLDAYKNYVTSLGMKM